ncbi:hypothetical protein J1605_002704 [Eschrichtius robustus]|uniref:Uncharacterized protein n=1 Tax=Eschrichtius robustus TaxID=9764 RepID=A0AB34HVM4_ESCRO|nr:hypothetical protein J1605_002704 [Eschrichtius robustus]
MGYTELPAVSVLASNTGPTICTFSESALQARGTLSRPDSGRWRRKRRPRQRHVTSEEVPDAAACGWELLESVPGAQGSPDCGRRSRPGAAGFALGRAALNLCARLRRQVRPPGLLLGARGCECGDRPEVPSRATSGTSSRASQERRV